MNPSWLTTEFLVWEAHKKKRKYFNLQQSETKWMKFLKMQIVCNISFCLTEMDIKTKFEANYYAQM